MANALVTFMLLLIMLVITFRQQVSVLLVELIWKLEDKIEELEKKGKH